MSGQTNLIQINPSATNQLTDASYVTDPIVTGGATTNAILPSPTFNKMDYQLSTFMAAFAVMLANKNYSTSDGSPSAAPTTPTPSAAVIALAGVLANILTNFDLPTIFTNTPLTGIPTAPTASSSTSTTQLATTQFVTTGIQVSISNAGSTPSYVRFPAWLGGLLVQWGRTSATSVSFAKTYSHIPSLNATGEHGSIDIASGSVTVNGFGIDSTGETFNWFAIGN